MDENTYRNRINTFNKVIVGLHRVGIAFGPMQLLTVKGRRTGRTLTFPIAVNKLRSGNYIFQAFPKAAWVANARAADAVTLTRGRTTSTAPLTEIPVDQRGPLLRELVTSSPASVGKRFVTTGLADAPTPDGVAAAAQRIAIFRVDPT
jgi:hypothetical protein